MKLLLALALAALLATVVGQLCPSQTLSAGIISDTLTFASGTNTPLQNGVNIKCFNYTFQASFSSAYQIAVATTGFEAVAATSDISYYVRPSPNSNLLNSISFQVRTPWRLGQWSKISVSFMAENRNDMELGTRIIDSTFVGGCGPRSQQMSFNFNQPQSITQSAVVRLFVNGISETSNGGSPFELRITYITPNSQGVTFNLTLIGASNIDTIYLSYVLYDSTTFAIPAIDGTFERTALFNSIVQQLPNTRIPSFNYALYGLAAFEFISSSPPSFSVKIESNFLLTAVGVRTTQSYYSISYFLVQGSCSACSNYPYLNGANCVQNCPQGYPVSGVCPAAQSCPQYSSWTSNGCVCNNNYYNISGICQQCPYGTSWNGYQCVQSGGFCGQNAFFNQSINQCQCNNNFYNSSGTCVPCPTGTQWSNYQCLPISSPCPINSYYNPGPNGLCQCVANYHNISGTCQQCPPGSLWNGQTCGPFIQPINCGQNANFVTQINQCQCNNGYYNISGTCQQCPTGTQWNGQACAWSPQPPAPNPDPTPNPNPSGPGIACPYGANCVMYCSSYANTVYNPAVGQCVCATNYYYIGGSCQSCPQGWSFNGVSCFQPRNCPPNSSPNGNTCVCNAGYMNTANGCVQSGIIMPPVFPGIIVPNPSGVTCAEGMYFNTRNQACVLCIDGCGSCTKAQTCNKCNPGYFLRSRKCFEICGDGIRFVLSCDDGNLRDGDGCSSTCRIEPGFSCFGGSPTTSDACTRDRPTGIKIYPTGQTHQAGKVITNVRVSWLPTELSASGCQDCLEVTMLSGTNTPRISTEYIQGTSYSFAITFDFTREPISDFKFRVRINPNMQRYFQGVDISDAAVVSVTPSLLAIDDPTDALDLQEVDEVNAQPNVTSAPPSLSKNP